MKQNNPKNCGPVVVMALVLAAIIVTTWLSQPATDVRGGSNWSMLMGSDIYAQWVIALFSVVGTGVSLWAVLLVYQSLELNREAVKAAWKAVDESSRIGEAEVSAYLTLQDIRVMAESESVSVVLNVTNHGNSPADHIEMTYVIWVNKPEPGSDEGWPDSIYEFSDPTTGSIGMSALPAHTTTPAPYRFQTGCSLARDDYGPNYEKLKFISLELVVFGKNVFGKEILFAARYDFVQFQNWDEAGILPLLERDKSRREIPPINVEKHRTLLGKGIN